MKLTMVITELDTGGAEKAFVRIALGLRQHGWEIDVVSLRDAGAQAEVLRHEGLTVTALNCGGFADVRAVSRLKNVFHKNHPDIVLSFLHQANIASRLAARWAGVRHHVSGIRVADRRFSLRLTEWLTQCCTTSYAAVSDSVRRVHAEVCGISPEKIRVIPNGVDTLRIDSIPAATRESLQLPDDAFVVLFAGRLSDQKRPHDALRAFAEYHSQTAGKRKSFLLIAGEGPLRSSLESEIRQLGLQESVRICGWRNDLNSIMKAANCLLLTSAWEGTPNVVLEAQAAMLPVLATRVDGCIELIDDKVTGYLVPPGELKELSGALRLIADNPLHAEQCARTAYAFVKSHVTWDQCVLGFHLLLSNLMSNGKN